MLRVSADRTPQGEPWQLTELGEWGAAPVRTADGEEIVFFVGESERAEFGDYGLWRIPVSGGEPRRTRRTGPG